ncbi:uncharacterized protein C8R40DRAFT_1172943 [Lentinula edodes]|uniref:uncharacterized protein n=1 Tax=Lentinula edodes TaxID=5353 RepID=UPI001E8CC6B0|nr:uncharacterized protein C8R40DRAFT_1172943 [Lentinula edodes]KAH7872887.1 hypothetical protein C8R40DRAFT_1172943 [Lentinula edodes]
MSTLDSEPVGTTPVPSSTRTTTDEIDNIGDPIVPTTTISNAIIGDGFTITGVRPRPGDVEPTRTSQSASAVEGFNTTIQLSSVAVNTTSTSPPFTFSSSSSSPSFTFTSSSPSPPSPLHNSGANSHIGVIIGSTIGGGVALAITIIVLVLVGIWCKRYKLKEMFLKLETKPAMSVPAVDRAGAGEGVPGAGGEITSGSGSHRGARFEASLYPLEHYPAHPAMILLPPAMSAGHDAVSIVGSRNSGSGRRSSRNMFIHRDREMVSINVDMLQGRVQEEVESQLEEQVPEEILPTYESLMSDLMTVGIQSRSSEHNGGRSRSGVGGSGELGVVENSTKWTTRRFEST